MHRLICIVAVSALLGAGACAKIPWIGPIFETKPVQHVEETAIADTAEAAAAMCGEDVHVEIDINPTTDPKCMHCPFHCPGEHDAVDDVLDPITGSPYSYQNSDSTWEDIFPPTDDVLINERHM